MEDKQAALMNMIRKIASVVSPEERPKDPYMEELRRKKDARRAAIIERDTPEAVVAERIADKERVDAVINEGLTREDREKQAERKLRQDTLRNMYGLD